MCCEINQKIEGLAVEIVGLEILEVRRGGRIRLEVCLATSKIGKNKK